MDAAVVAQGSEYIVQRLALGAVHLYVATGHHGHAQLAGQLI